MARNRLLETIMIDILALARIRVGSSNQPPAALEPAVVPLTSGVMEPRASKVLPGQMIMPLAWPVEEQYGRPAQSAWDAPNSQAGS